MWIQLAKLLEELVSRQNIVDQKGGVCGVVQDSVRPSPQFRNSVVYTCRYASLQQ